jgi:hypothetical protein
MGDEALSHFRSPENGARVEESIALDVRRPRFRVRVLNDLDENGLTINGRLS